jgi:hypothetical protein
MLNTPAARRRVLIGSVLITCTSLGAWSFIPPPPTGPFDRIHRGMPYIVVVSIAEPPEITDDYINQEGERHDYCEWLLGHDTVRDEPRGALGVAVASARSPGRRPKVWSIDLP